MATFKYKITDKYGKDKKGTVEAASEDAARQKLKGDGAIVHSVQETTSLDNAAWNISIGNPVKLKDITLFCRQFYSMLNAGVTVVEGLKMMQTSTENAVLRKSLYNVQVNVEKGETLANAMALEGKVFPDLLINMVAAGEATGNLSVAFERICTQFEKDQKLRSMLTSAMIYPVVVLIVAVGVVIILMVNVIPNFQEIFKTMGEDLPLPTKIVIAVSDFMVANLVFVIGGIIAIIVLILYFKNTESGKQINSKLSLKIPIIKDFSIKNACAKFSMTMSTLIMSGVPLVEAIGIVANVIENRVIRKILFDARDDVMQGIPMSEPLEASEVFPQMVYHMIRIGEETGNTEAMLDKVAEYYEQEVETATKNLTTAMEPAVIVLLAVVVGGVVGAIVMPMMKIYEMAG
ncbi:type II secretion system F family protein [Eubacterium xylanophilum]|uniref:type II secretion system F family protein n=1 Tax=Eubacterium xylanophilum TaxID=39497 RepID=UPI00047B2C37|nr:type II secretion system F family protein [Eubacterium xylanophilum]